jgi:hypothetical protein
MFTIFADKHGDVRADVVLQVALAVPRGVPH